MCVRCDFIIKKEKLTLIGVFVCVSSSDTDLGDEREFPKAAAGDHVCNISGETPRTEDFLWQKWL